MVREVKKFQNVIKETRKVAMLNPVGHNAKNAYVTSDGEPCCIFGHVLGRMNLLPSAALNNFTFGDLPWQEWGFEPLSEYEKLWALKVQSAADNGNAWIVAVLMAEFPLINALVA